jgi:hypothetical protein
MLKTDDYNKILSGNQGTIIKDFNTLLGYIVENGGVALTKSETAFSMSDLLSLNEIFSNPQKTGLSRPQQKAFPYINSLFLLLRLSVLAFVKKEKNKSVIHIDATALNSWKQLKPVEQYGHLLTYLLHPEGNAILGERYFGLLQNISWLHNDQKRILGYINNREHHGFQDYQLAALDLFGILSIKPMAPKVGKSWDFEHVSITPFGDDIIKFVSTSLREAFDLSSVDTLFSMVQPLFPHWKTLMKAPKKEPQLGIHIFKISLGKAWRQIAIKGDVDLHSFGDVILDAFEFDNDHLHEFSFKNQHGVIEKIFHYSCDEALSSDEVLIGELNLQIGSEMIYLFDFGDSWRFHIVLEELDPEALKLKKPVILKKYGEAPVQYEYGEDLDDLDYFDDGCQFPKKYQWS